MAVEDWKPRSVAEIANDESVSYEDAAVECLAVAERLATMAADRRPNTLGAGGYLAAAQTFATLALATKLAIDAGAEYALRQLRGEG